MSRKLKQRKSRSIAQRKKLCRNAGWRCWYCGKSFTLITAQVEHVTPLSRGGLDKLSNIVMACQVCNLDKSAMTLEEYRTFKRMRKFFGEIK